MASEMVRAAARLTAVPVMPGGSVANVAEHLHVSASARLPVSAIAAPTSREEATSELMPRVVFHGVPTREEAQEATSELVDAIGRMYPWSRESGSSSNSQVGPARGSSETTTGSLASSAFSLLHEPRFQNAVSSLASDPNMFAAIRGNQDYQDFCRQARQPSHAFVTGAARPFAMLPQGPGIGRTSNDAEYQTGISFEDLFKMIQCVVDVTMKSISYFVKILFSGEGVRSLAATFDHGTDPGASELGTDPGASEHGTEVQILALVLMVTMLIFLKRIR